MKKIYQDKDFAKVGYYKTILEENGVPAMLKNEHLNGLFGDVVSIPVFHPSIYVKDNYAEEAVKILQEYEQSWEERQEIVEDWLCSSCGEENPKGFEACWNCQTEYKQN